ncbi:MAG: endonuclease YncB(thermonuclease family) [Paracoccaceae bacterium]
MVGKRAGSSRAPRVVRAGVVAVTLVLAAWGGAAWGASARHDATGALAEGRAVAGRVTVVDGDTLILATAAGRLRVRLHGIDAPEAAQTCADAKGAVWRCGETATAALAALAGGASARCVSEGYFSFDRLVAACSVGGADLGAGMVRGGHARAAASFTDRYVAAESAARAAELGLWQGASVSPQDWRRGARLAAEAAPRRACAIKGNISKAGRIYHLPDSRDYARTRITPEAGERWFCSEADARAAGWRAVRG